jgi:alpha-D-ribose 1-methylphosphonate 5-triphosphate diphosphatase
MDYFSEAQPGAASPNCACEAGVTVLTNARIVLSDEIVRGSVEIRDGRVSAIGTLSTLPGGIDCEDDYLIAGIVDEHTDNLERQILPRENARWPSRSAMLAHDAQCAAAGVTTVLDALCVGDLGFDTGRIDTCRNGIADLDALSRTGLLKSEHFLHLRCELPAVTMQEELTVGIDNALLRLVSLMDHSPGNGQYADLEKYRRLRRREGRDPAYIEQRIVELQAQREKWRDRNRRAVLEALAGRDIAIASHDDRTVEEIEENGRDGIRISEFPVRLEAAQAARTHGMEVIVGAPNLVRGGSHSGNVSAATLVEAGVVDALASDYVPASLLEAAFIASRLPGMTLPRAISLITERPAQMCRLPDRGRVAEGLRADLVRVRLHEDLPVIRAVWRSGERIA